MSAAQASTPAGSVVVRGRERELANVYQMVDNARAGHGGALAFLGDPGIGVTTLLRVARDTASDFLAIGTCGVEAERGIELGGLHRLLQPMIDRIADLPAQQAAVLSGALGTGDGYPDGGLRLFSAVHNLLTGEARNGPVLVWVDDLQWVDRVSLAALAFTARRLETVPVLMVFAGRPEDAGDELLAGIQQVPLDALDDAASLRLLEDQAPHQIPEDLSHDLVELAAGNPLTLVELAGALTAEQLSGQAPPPDQLPSNGRQRRYYSRRLRGLSPDAQRLVLMAVADDDLEVVTLARAAAKAGIELAVLEEVKGSGLVRLDGDLVEVPGPLVRPTLYADAALADRQAVHELLASALDPDEHRLRWIWHQVAATAEPRSRLADELDAAAREARSSGDRHVSVRLSQRAAALTSNPEEKARRLLDAATGSWQIGHTRAARALLRQIRPLANSLELRGRADLMHGQIELREGLPAMAHRDLVNAAELLLETDRQAALTAFLLAGEASHMAGDHPQYSALADRIVELRRPDDPPATLLVFAHFEGIGHSFQGRHEASVPAMRQVVELAERLDCPLPKILGSQAAYNLGQGNKAAELSTQAVSAARTRDEIHLLPWALMYLSMSGLLLDRHRSAVSSSLEGLRVAEAIGHQNCAYSHLTLLGLLAASQGDRETALLRLDKAADGVARRGLGRTGAISTWALSMVDLMDDRPADAMDRLRLMAAGTGLVHPGIRAMAAPQFVEAAVRCGQRAKAAQALEVYHHWASTTGSEARLALSHRCHALLAASSAVADEHFREAIRLHRASDTALELAKTELLYAHRLRRGRKPRAARELLRDALKIFQRYDAEYWANRTRTELRAAGEAVQGGAAPNTIDELTPQQVAISRLVAEGATNREIASQLVLSHRTVEHHLRNVFAKLGVRSRVELSSLLR
jgi:DNA-binding NarL/FixJ family response regulator/tetratricopeptide (TPR) repeat protein